MAGWGAFLKVSVLCFLLPPTFFYRIERVLNNSISDALAVEQTV